MRCHAGPRNPRQPTCCRRNGLKIQLSFSYSDGFGREIQKKIQAEPGPLVEGGPVVNPRWVGSGWTIFNNKGKPVRQYEPFFSATHRFEFGVTVGVSPVLFYDPVERVVATLHPNHTYEKVVFDPWQQTTYDVNDTRRRQRPDRRPAHRSGHPAATWRSTSRRQPGDLADLARAAHRRRAWARTSSAQREKAAAHADTPTTAHFDALGRPFLTVAHNGFDAGTTATAPRTASPPASSSTSKATSARCAMPSCRTATRIGRIVMRYAYDMLGNRIHQLSMEAGARWMLNDVAGKPIRAWDSRGHRLRTAYDALRRPTEVYLQEGSAIGAAGRQDRVRREPAEPGGEQPARQAVSSLRRRGRRHHRRLRLQGQPA